MNLRLYVKISLSRPESARTRAYNFLCLQFTNMGFSVNYVFHRVRYSPGRRARSTSSCSPSDTAKLQRSSSRVWGKRE